MYTHIIGLEGPHIGLFSHILKKTGYFYFNENTDESDLETYTENKNLEQFYRHLNYDVFELDQNFINELFGFIKNCPNNLATNNFRDIVCTQNLLNTPFAGKVIYIQYDYADINSEFLDSVTEVEYNKNLLKLNEFIENVKQSNWKLITINYPLFLSDLEYRKTKLIEILKDYTSNPTTAVDEFLENIYNIKTTDDPDDIEGTEFEYLVAQYNDTFTTTLLDDIIQNIPEADLDSDGELTLGELKDYVENQTPPA